MHCENFPSATSTLTLGAQRIVAQTETQEEAGEDSGSLAHQPLQDGTSEKPQVAFSIGSGAAKHAHSCDREGKVSHRRMT